MVYRIRKQGGLCSHLVAAPYSYIHLPVWPKESSWQKGEPEQMSSIMRSIAFERRPQIISHLSSSVKIQAGGNALSNSTFQVPFEAGVLKPDGLKHGPPGPWVAPRAYIQGQGRLWNHRGLFGKQLMGAVRWDGYMPIVPSCSVLVVDGIRRSDFIHGHPLREDNLEHRYVQEPFQVRLATSYQTHGRQWAWPRTPRIGAGSRRRGLRAHSQNCLRWTDQP